VKAKEEAFLARRRANLFVDPSPLTAKQMEKNFMNRDKGVCTKPVCVAERTLHDEMKIYLSFNVAPAGAILHIMMKSVRTFVHHFDMFFERQIGSRRCLHLLLAPCVKVCCVHS
jgi:hypothetical protein